MQNIQKYFNVLVEEVRKNAVDYYVLALFTCISVLSFLYYFRKGYILIYGDAAAHLNISRRVIDSLTPGFVQLGSVWLPLQHILTLPLIWNNYLWHTGIAGSVVSMLSYVVATFFVYKTASDLSKSRLAGFVAACVLGLNVNFLYLQASPMTEPLMLATVSLFFYFILQWQKKLSTASLICAAFFAMLASMTRYEGWFLIGFGAIYVFWISFRKRSFKKAEGNVFLYSVLAFYGIAMWFLYNWFILGSPTYFLSGPYSANHQQEGLALTGGLPTKHNLSLSLLVYLWDIVDVIGIPVIAVAFISLIFFANYKKQKQLLPYILMYVSLPLLIIFTLYAGITVIYVPQVSINGLPGGLFNLRYALMTLPFIAIVSSLIVRNNRLLAVAIILITLAQGIFFYAANQVIVINDATVGREQANYNGQEIATALHQYCDKRLILMSAGSYDPLFLTSNIDLKYFISEGSYGYWQTSLKDPTKYAYCVVMGTKDNPDDLIRTHLITNKKFQKNYHVVVRNDMGMVYVKNGNTLIKSPQRVY